MSRNDYYNASREEILKRLKCIQEENIVDFFEESDSFSLAIYLAYFALAEEVLIERDSHNPDISTRFKRHIDPIRLEELFRNPNLIKIYDKLIYLRDFNYALNIENVYLTDFINFLTGYRSYKPNSKLYIFS